MGFIKGSSAVQERSNEPNFKSIGWLEKTEAFFESIFPSPFMHSS